MKVDAVVSASKEFLRTREGVHALPSIHGLVRYVEATMAMYNVFVPECSSSFTPRLAFGVWRLVLIAVSETTLLGKKAVRLWLR
jgi:hypothetical protein